MGLPFFYKHLSFACTILFAAKERTPDYQQ